MRRPFSLHQRNYYPELFIGVVIAANVVTFLLLPAARSPEFFLTITGAVAAFVHFLYSQHNQNTDHFIGLFRDFNARYDRLNSGMNALLQRNDPLLLNDKDKQLLYDYFNLCAEEYLYFKAGYIDREVWRSWLQGMKYFASNTEVRRLWQDELASGSYYGFALSFVDEVY